MLFLQKNSLKTFFKTIINLLFPLKINSFELYKNLLSNKSGLEIGGPSKLFSKKGLLPIYPYLNSLDNCNFSNETIWEGRINYGYSFEYDKNHSLGRQYVLDATELNGIPSNQFDFILSSHVIEHIANPIKALFEWIRLLKDEGIFVIVLPHKDGTFDHKRNITKLSHLINDYNSNTPENDLTHLDEILELHDLEKDPLAGSFEQFRMRALNNFANRCLHHHVFNSYSAVRLIDFVKLKIISVEAILPYHIIIIARKTKDFGNHDIINKFTSNKFKSPFFFDNSSE